MKHNKHIEPLEARLAPAFTALDLGALTGANGFRFDGAAGTTAGDSIAGAGDVNGDGFDDFIIGAPEASPGGKTNAGEAYVVFGDADGFPASLSPAALDGTNGFRLLGALAGDFTGAAVGSAGDVNGDGFDDVVVGAPFADDVAQDNAGWSYVVFGHGGAFSAALNLISLNGEDGFRVIGALKNNFSGTAVGSAGDFNGDGFDDVLIGAPGTDQGMFKSVGGGAIVFGHSDNFPSVIGIGSLKLREGLRLYGATGSGAGSEVASAGDVNGDRLGDIILSAPHPGGAQPGGAYVVFGFSEITNLGMGIANLGGERGFEIVGADVSDDAGTAVAGAGDVNHDGFDDVIVGARLANGGAGAAYVVYGKASGFASDLAVSSLDGVNGFTLSGPAASFAGGAVSGAGDVNGDGIDDLIVGAPLADAAFVVFGKSAGFGASVALGSLDGASGFRLDGIDAGDGAGGAVAAAGDVNGDGFADFLVSASGADGMAGEGYLVFGSNGGNTVSIGADAKTATFTDVDGDRVTIRVSKGALGIGDFLLTGANALGGATLLLADFAGDTDLEGASVTISAKPQLIGGVMRGDGLVNVGAIEAADLNFGTVKVGGDLGRIEVSSVKTLLLNSLGLAGLTTQRDTDASLTSIVGSVAKLTVKTGIDGATFVGARIGSAKIGGDVTDAKFVISQAIKSLTIGGDLEGTQIVGGGSIFGGNADAQIGRVFVRGDWIASSLAAGVSAGADGLYGTGDDKVFPGGDTAIVSRIASVVIGGQAFGSFEKGGSFAIEAQQIGSIRVGKTTLPLRTDAPDDLQLGPTGDFRVRELA